MVELCGRTKREEGKYVWTLCFSSASELLRYFHIKLNHCRPMMFHRVSVHFCRTTTGLNLLLNANYRRPRFVQLLVFLLKSFPNYWFEIWQSAVRRVGIVGHDLEFFVFLTGRASLMWLRRVLRELLAAKPNGARVTRVLQVSDDHVEATTHNFKTGPSTGS